MIIVRITEFARNIKKYTEKAFKEDVFVSTPKGALKLVPVKEEEEEEPKEKTKSKK